MDSRRYKFEFANRTFLSLLCDIFEEEVPKSYLPSGIEAETNIKFMPISYPPYNIYYEESGTNRHITCGALFLMIKEVALQMKAK